MTHRIFIVHPSPLVTDYEAHGDGLLATRFMRELAARGHEVHAACERVRLHEPLPSSVTLYPIVTSTGSARRIEYALRMRALFDRLHAARPFDLAHQLNPVYAGLSLGLAGRNIPLVLGPYVAHWPHARASRRKTVALDALTRVQQHRADALVVCGDAARARIARDIAPGLVHVVPYGIDPADFPAVPLPDGAPAVLFLAGLSERKGIGVLLRAFERLAASHPTVRLIVGGDGPLRDAVAAQVAASAYASRIELLGSVARRDVPAVLARATAFCLPSLGEPYGMSLVEAMAAGRPVVATAAGGPLDLVDPAGGRLVPPGDADALAATLAAVLADPDGARRMGEANARAVARFAWPAVIDRLEAVYDAAIAHHGGTGSARMDAPVGGETRSMPVLVTNDFPPDHGGIQRMMSRLADEFAARGAGVTVVAPAAPGAAETDAARAYRVRRYRRAGRLGSFAAMTLALLATRLGRRSAPILASMWFPGGLATCALPRPLRGRFGVLAHGTEIAPRRGGLRRRLMRYVFARADVVIANSRFTEGLLRDAGITARIDVVHPGIDGTPIEPQRAVQPTIVSVGRLIARKGFDTTIAALPAIARRVPDVRYEIVGDGPQRAELEALAARLGVAERVTFLGSVSDDVLHAALARAWCFALPARAVGPDVEGFGLVYLEAALAALPAVGGAGSGAADAIEDGVTGVLVDGTSVEAVAAALEGLLTDPERAARMGDAGRRRALTSFTWRGAADTMLPLLRGERAAAVR